MADERELGALARVCNVQWSSMVDRHQSVWPGIRLSSHHWKKEEEKRYKFNYWNCLKWFLLYLSLLMNNFYILTVHYQIYLQDHIYERLKPTASTRYKKNVNNLHTHLKPCISVTASTNWDGICETAARLPRIQTRAPRSTVPRMIFTIKTSGCAGV